MFNIGGNFDTKKISQIDEDAVTQREEVMNDSIHHFHENPGQYFEARIHAEGKDGAKYDGEQFKLCSCWRRSRC